MNKKTQYKVTLKVKDILDRIMLPQFPNLNTYKIASFYTKTINAITNMVFGIALILFFTMYLPTFLSFQEIVITLLCSIILMQKSQIDQGDID